MKNKEFFGVHICSANLYFDKGDLGNRCSVIKINGEAYLCHDSDTKENTVEIINKLELQ